MKFRTFALGTIAAAAAVIGLAAPASADVACNRHGDCWHTSDHYNYHRSWGIRVHDDGWKWRGRDHYRWREHEGRGYWRNGAWVTF
jgi:hypothetical protein